MDVRATKKLPKSRCPMPFVDFCKCDVKNLTSMLVWLPKALFATGGILTVVGSILIGLGVMAAVRYPQGLAAGIPLFVFGIIFLILCVVCLVVRHVREWDMIKMNGVSISRDQLNRSMSSYGSSMSSPRAVQYAQPSKSASSLDTERSSVVTGEDPYRKAPSSIESVAGVTDTGTGYYYVADDTNPHGGYYVHATSGIMFYVDENTCQFTRVDPDDPMGMPRPQDGLSGAPSVASSQNTRWSGASSSRFSSFTNLSSISSPTKKKPGTLIRPSSSVGRRRTVNFESEVSVLEVNKGGARGARYKRQMRNVAEEEKPRPKIFTDPFADDGLTFRTRPESSRPRSGRPSSGRPSSGRPSSDTTDSEISTNVFTADIHVHQVPKEIEREFEEDDVNKGVTKIYVKSENNQSMKRPNVTAAINYGYSNTELNSNDRPQANA